MRQPQFLRTAEFRAGALSGVLLAAAVPPSPLGMLGYVGLVPVLQLLFSPRKVRQGRPLRLGTLILSFGLVRHLIELHWLVLLGDASPLTFKWALPFMLILLALYATWPEALVLWVLARIRDRRGVQGIWWAPGLWVMAEWLRGSGEMGFPWLGLASTQLRYVPMLQISGLLGELGVTLLVVWANVLVTLTWLSLRGDYPSIGRAVLPRWWAPVTLALMLGITLVYGVMTTASLERSDRDELRVGIVQANVDLKDKWDPAKRDSTFVPYTQMTRALASEGARLVIWPETALPMDLPRRPEYLGIVRDLVRESGVFLYSGFVERQVREDGRLDSFNSSFLMGDDGVFVDYYRKMHLLPFGERMPFQGVIPLLGRLDFGQAEWTPGPRHTVFEVDGNRFAALICFESIFSRFGRRGVANGAGFLVNVTNDGWFGNTLLPHQHTWLAVMRASENRVPLLRVANNGISFAVLPSGRMVESTSLFTRERFLTDVTPRPGGSFYTRHGDLPLALLILAGGIFLLVIGRAGERVPAR